MNARLLPCSISRPFSLVFCCPCLEKGSAPKHMDTYIKFQALYNLLRRPDGSFNRELNEFLDRKVPANIVPVDGVFSFDMLDESTKLLNRVYMLPREEGQWGLEDLEKPLSTAEVVPVIVFFHGGSFTHSSANSAIYDTLCRCFVTVCKAVVVSVNYRRSPEHRYPAACDDGWSAVKWVSTRPWLQSGEGPKVHVYLAGDSYCSPCCSQSS